MNATRRAGLLSAVPLLAVLALPASNVAAQATTTLDIATAYPEGNFHVLNLQQFAQDVEAATRGAVKVKVHPGGTLAKAPDIRKAVTEGRIAAGEVFGPSLSSLHGVFGLDGIPFFATNYTAARKLWKASEAMVISKLDGEGLTLLMSVPWPPQGLFAAKPITIPKDLVGLWMRENSPPLKRLAELIDAKPVRVETPELAAAAKEGKLDLVFTSAAQGIDTKLAQSLKHYYLANAWLPRNVVFINSKTLAALPKEQQQTILDLAKRAETRGWAASEAFAESSTKALQQAGALVSPLPAEVKSRLERMGNQVASEVLKSGDPELWALAAKALL
jgi:TRAP-type transport system periplasmic protein